MRYVYFIKPVGLDGPIKIGSSKLPETRLAQLMIWSPWPLEIAAQVPGDISLEFNIHDCFADAHSHNEWFHSTPRLRKAIAEIQAGVPADEAIDLSRRQKSIRKARPKSEGAKRHRSLGVRAWWARRKTADGLGFENAYTVELPKWVVALVDASWKRELTKDEQTRFDAFTKAPESHCTLNDWIVKHHRKEAA